MENASPTTAASNRRIKEIDRFIVVAYPPQTCVRAYVDALPLPSRLTLFVRNRWTVSEHSDNFHRHLKVTLSYALVRTQPSSRPDSDIRSWLVARGKSDEAIWEEKRRLSLAYTPVQSISPLLLTPCYAAVMIIVNSREKLLQINTKIYGSDGKSLHTASMIMIHFCRF